MSRVSVYIVLVMTMCAIILVWFPNPATRIIFSALFLITMLFMRFDKKLQEYNRRNLKLPGWLLSDWTFWILMTIYVVLSIHLFVSY